MDQHANSFSAQQAPRQAGLLSEKKGGHPTVVSSKALMKWVEDKGFDGMTTKRQRDRMARSTGSPGAHNIAPFPRQHQVANRANGKKQTNNNHNLEKA
jgi:hypothetical protein